MRAGSVSAAALRAMRVPCLDEPAPPYLADAIEARRAEGEDVGDELIAHLSPVAWEPVNFLERVMNFRHLAHLKNATRTADFGPLSASGPRLLRLAAVRMVHNTL